MNTELNVVTAGFGNGEFAELSPGQIDSVSGGVWVAALGIGVAVYLAVEAVRNHVREEAG